MMGARAMRVFRLTAAVVIFPLSLWGAEQAEEEKASKPEATETASEDIETTLERQQSLREAFGWEYGPGWLTDWRDWRQERLEKWGIDISMSYDSLAMAGLG